MVQGRRSTEWGAAKAQLIAAAQEMLIERFGEDRTRPEAITTALAFLDPATVAARAGVARSAFNHHWGNPSGDDDGLTAFQRFVGDVFTTELGDPIDQATMATAAAHGGDYLEVVRSVLASEIARYERAEQRAAWRSSVAISIFGGADKAGVAELVDGIVEFDEKLLNRFGYRTVPGVTVRQLAVAVMAHIDGVLLGQLYGHDALEHNIERTDPHTGEPSMWSMAEVCVTAIVEQLTEPIDG